MDQLERPVFVGPGSQLFTGDVANKCRMVFTTYDERGAEEDFMQTLKSPLARFSRRAQTHCQNSPDSPLPSCAAGQRRNASEDGYVLLAVLFLVALILIGLAVAAPKMAQEIRRDKESELY